MTEQNYYFQLVANQLTQALSDEIIAFWTDLGVLSLEQAQQRVQQVLQVARTEAHSPIIGICTAYTQQINSLGFEMYLYRSLIHPQHRSHGLARDLLNNSFQLLNQQFATGQITAKGMMLDIENDQLKQRKDLIWDDAYNLTFVGYGPNGNHLRLAYFTGATLD